MSLLSLNQSASDLGIVIALESLAVDSWCTRARVRIEQAPWACSVTGARLIPFDVTGEAPAFYDPLPLCDVTTSPAEQQVCDLLFGALPPQAACATLLLTRLQLEETHTEVAIPAGFDPFDPYETDSAIDRVRAFHQREDDEMMLAPAWECRGQWAYRINLPVAALTAPLRHALSLLQPVGPVAIVVPFVDFGARGTLVAVEIVPPGWTDWGSDWKLAALRALEDGARIPVPDARFVVQADGMAWHAPPRGPYGSLCTRRYYDGPHVSDTGSLTVTRPNSGDRDSAHWSVLSLLVNGRILALLSAWS